MYRKDFEDIFTRLREYDSVSFLLRKCFPKKSFTFPWRKASNVIRLRCFDVHEDFIAFGWSNGAISIVERKSDGIAHSFEIGNQRTSFPYLQETILPTWLALRETDSLIVVCSCICSSKRNGELTTRLSQTELSVVLIFRIPISKARKLIMSKMVRHVIKGIHHNPVFAPLYVSPLADVIISGDIRGSVVHSRYNNQLSTYHSGVLTVVPGSLTDLKLVQGSLLLLTCRAFPQDRPVTDDDDNNEEDEAVEIVQEPEALYFLYDIASRTLTRLDLNSLLPPKLNLTLSCAAPVWLPKQSLSKPLRFICPVNPAECAVPSAGCPRGGSNDEQVKHWLAGPSGVVAVVFAIHDQLNVSVERLITLQTDPQSAAVYRIPVLTSVVSTANHPSPNTTALAAADADDSNLRPPNPRRPSCASSTGVSRQSVASGIHSSVSASEKRLSLFSDRTLILWSTESPSTVQSASSILAFIQLDLYRDPEPGDSSLPTSPSRVLAYSTQLGPIASIAVVPLKPWSGPVPLSPSDWTLPRGGCGGLGLEVWVHRELPDPVRDQASAMVLLSTRPLCVNRLAVSPFADLHSLFTDQKRDHRHSQQLTGVASGPLGQPDTPEPDVETVGVERGVEALTYLMDQSDVLVSQSLCNTEPELATAVDDKAPCNNDDPTDSGQLPQTCVLLRESPEPRSEPEITLPDSGISTVPSHHRSISSASANSQMEINDALWMSHSPIVDQPPVPVSHQPASVPESGFDSAVMDVVDHGSTVPTEHVSVTSQSVTDGSCVSCLRDGENDDLMETTRLPTSDDTWFVFSGPPASAVSKPSLADGSSLELLLSDPRTELVPLVQVSGGGGGRPGLAVFDVERIRVEWIMAPKAFGEVQSFHVSPDGCVVWCLRKSNSTHSDGSLGHTVDVYLDNNGGGIRGLARAWIADQCGQWEQDVLRRVVSLDLSDHRAIFSTTSGNVKIQFDLSANRPYCQSYTWPCPDYHVHQVAMSACGIVWALASTRLTDSHNSTVSSSPHVEDLCLLSAYLPDVLKSRGSNPGLAQHAQSSTTPTPSVIKSHLKSSQWIPLALPSTIQPAVLQLVNQASTMPALSCTVNSLFQLALTAQRTAFGPVTVSPPAVEYTMGWLLCTASQTPDSHGCAFLLPNLNPPYKADDADWYEVAIDCPDSTRLAGTALQVLMKRMNLSSSVPSMLKLPTHVVRTARDGSTNPLAVCPRPLWVLVHRSTTTNDLPRLLVKRLRSSLTVYRWRKFRPRLQTTYSASSTVNERYVWRFPLLLVNGLSNGTVGEKAEQVPDSCLWTLNTVANELFCHLGPRHTRSLPIPENSAERDAVTAMCLIRDRSDRGVSHLLVATQTGCLWSRLGLSNLSPMGTMWVSEAVPAHWTANAASTASGDWRSRSHRRATYCSSAVHVNGELWITDSGGNLASTRVELVRKSDGTARLLSSNWTVHASPSPDRPGGCGSIHFLSVSGFDWEHRQQGQSLWAVGLPAREANKLAQPIADHDGALVYARCWSPDDASFVWSHVPAPPARSIHVSEDRVWLVSSTQPRQIYLRFGLVDTALSRTQRRSSISSSTPAPLESEIGHAWHSIPLPDPIRHTFQVDCLVAAVGSDTVLGGHRIDALCLSSSPSGAFLSLSIAPETLFFGPTPLGARSRSTSIARPAELIALDDQASPVDC